MSTRYPGGIISKTAPTPSGPYQDDTAPGLWTLEQQAYWDKIGQWPTAGNIRPIGQQLYIGNYNSSGSGTVDSYSFVVPAGVTSICAVCIGSGASGLRSDSASQSGRAGDLRYINNLPVTPGETLTINVAQGTATPTTSQFSGNSSSIVRASNGNVLLSAVGGSGISSTNGTASTATGAGPYGGTVGGGNGGNGGTQSSTIAGGGGGTGGYNGDGGTGQNSGSTFATTPAAGSGAAYGGNNSTGTASSGGGVNVMGIGTTATGGAQGASYGAYGSTTSDGPVGIYGAGGGGNDGGTGSAIAGKPGAVRIFWNGSRSFPSNAGDYLPMSASSFTQIELRIRMFFNGSTNVNNYSIYLSEIEILDETNTNMMRSPTVLTAVAGSNTLTFAGLSNNQFGVNTSSITSTDTQTFNNGTVGTTYISISRNSVDTINVLVKLSSARKIKQIKLATGSSEGNYLGVFPYVEVYGDGSLIGAGCPLISYDTPTSGNATSTLTFT